MGFFEVININEKDRYTTGFSKVYAVLKLRASNELTDIHNLFQF